MSEPAAEGGKKKGGKMPMMIVMVAVLGGGGYFGMKSSAPKAPPPEPPPMLGDVMELGKEFIINLREREIFLRATVVVQMDKNSHVGHGGGGGGHGKAGPSKEEIIMRNTVIERLKTLSLADLNKPQFDAKLRYLLAKDLNHQLHLLHEAEEAAKGTATKKKKDKKEKDDDSHGDSHGASHGPMPGDIDKVDLAKVKEDWEDEAKEWDSEEGDVLRIFFTDFATMRE